MAAAVNSAIGRKFAMACFRSVSVSGCRKLNYLLKINTNESDGNWLSSCQRPASTYAGTPPGTSGKVLPERLKIVVLVKINFLQCQLKALQSRHGGSTSTVDDRRLHKVTSQRRHKFALPCPLSTQLEPQYISSVLHLQEVARYLPTMPAGAAAGNSYISERSTVLSARGSMTEFYHDDKGCKKDHNVYFQLISLHAAQLREWCFFEAIALPQDPR